MRVLPTTLIRSKKGLTGVVVAATVAVGMVASIGAAAPAAEVRRAEVSLNQLVPVPVEVRAAEGAAFELRSGAQIQVTAGVPAATDAGTYLATLLKPATGFALPVKSTTADRPGDGISLLLGGADPRVGAQGYELDVTRRSVVIRANEPAGLFSGVQTLRQLLPVRIEAATRQSGPWTVQTGHILDYPRYAYRGALLDVARHFFPVETVKTYIDNVARYKVNYLHLHLTDDAGWRIAIDSWPKLATFGGSSGVGGQLPGHYSKTDFREIVAYAAARGITVVPEIEGPGHSQAALASYAKLNCDGKAKELYTGYVPSPDGLLCVRKAITYKFLDDVIREIAALTPGPYLHIGSDEAHSMAPEDFAYYISKVTPIVRKYGKKLIGWQEMVNGQPGEAIGQYWINGVNNDEVAAAAAKGTKFIMTPADHAYLDMKYNDAQPAYPLGNVWAGTTEVDDAYNWQPDTELPGVDESAVAGVEAALWTETVFALEHIEALAFPRLLATAEIGWSPKTSHNWDAFAERLAAQGPRLRTARVNYTRAGGVSWAGCS
ncbi:beta-N-acetylhexosaminidase [Micromonospora sp. R77]|uniref:beta-N-acetylhexosaminidase n=1 Tax=Micromonospora sp. R77 TaxID=2925836 RepID=UPI001F607DEB|nr:beta-N-acetylhexosaminidase [Micromonospora sp. R77]MCI4065598.1 beta-N-acetylhexosaminidase [Micromonospora sp. R77]